MVLGASAFRLIAYHLDVNGDASVLRKSQAARLYHACVWYQGCRANGASISPHTRQADFVSKYITINNPRHPTQDPLFSDIIVEHTTTYNIDACT